MHAPPMHAPGVPLALLALAATVVAPDGVVPAGERLVARMNRTIGTTPSLGPDRVADVTRAGGEFVATLETPVVDERGRARLTPGALVQGHVVRAERGQGLHAAKLELAVDRIDGRPIDARVAGVEVQQIASSSPATHVEGVAFWGALIGGLAFGIPGVAVGYGAGGSAAAVNAARARSTDAWISAGSLLTIELTAPLHLGPADAAPADHAPTPGSLPPPVP